MINGELIVDNFAGGGGASTGIEMATGYSVDIGCIRSIIQTQSITVKTCGRLIL